MDKLSILIILWAIYNPDRFMTIIIIIAATIGFGIGYILTSNNCFRDIGCYGYGSV